MTINEMQSLLNNLMRGIDKKTALTVQASTDSSQGALSVHLSRDKRSGSLQSSEADLIAAQTDLMRRNQLRSALKRARDKMWEGNTGHIFSTKLEAHKTEGMQWNRSSQGGRGRR
jgi:hypothetical protein